MFISKIMFVFTAFFLTFFSISFDAKADLTITPLKLIFDGRDRTKDVHIINTSNRTNTYRVAFMYNKALPEGKIYEVLDGPIDPNYDPADMLFMSPKQVTIAPGKSQKIKVSLRRPADLPDGEYRVHLRFQKLINENDLLVKEKKVEGMSMAVVVNMGFAIPIVIRQGDYNAKANIEEFKFTDIINESSGLARASVKISRSGIHSVAGTIELYWIKDDGVEEKIGFLNNASVYTEIGSRTSLVDIKYNDINSGKIKVVYRADKEHGSKIYDQKIFNIN